jgi:hypothetical protein
MRAHITRNTFCGHSPIQHSKNYKSVANGKLLFVPTLNASTPSVLYAGKDCPEVFDEERVEKKQKEYLQTRKKAKKPKPTKATAHAWRPPEDDEHGKRIIYGRPYTWNENRKGWDKDETPDHGIAVNQASTNTSNNDNNTRVP